MSSSATEARLGHAEVLQPAEVAIGELAEDRPRVRALHRERGGRGGHILDRDLEAVRTPDRCATFGATTSTKPGTLTGRFIFVANALACTFTQWLLSFSCNQTLISDW